MSTPEQRSSSLVTTFGMTSRRKPGPEPISTTGPEQDGRASAICRYQRR
jgi:hypothetical protein